MNKQYEEIHSVVTGDHADTLNYSVLGDISF